MLLDMGKLERLLEEYAGGQLPEEEKRWLFKLICGQVEILVHDLLRDWTVHGRKRHEPLTDRDRGAPS
ncbi:hypothetical protein [Neomoorella thermoacetica]|uniref:hypothetical protein n=1 Tax=Neomoorella thermoacetica TaxID=1525 RepID=UPI0011E7F377|nr:hypothetical protein [Moorella thermoacetica]